MTDSHPIISPAFAGNNIRIFGTPDEPLFIAKDICEALEIEWRFVRDRLPEWSKGGLVKTATLGGEQDMATVTEGGLFFLVLRSDKPSALKFAEWVCREVLPELRRQGFYLISGGAPAALAEVQALTLRLKSAQLRLQAEILDRQASLAVDVPDGVPITEWLKQREPDLEPKIHANRVRSLKRELLRRDHPVGRRSACGNKRVSARPDDIDKAYAALTANNWQQISQ